MSEGLFRRFKLVRTEDVNGVSGVGDVAMGVEFPDGTVALRWAGGFPTSITAFDERGIESVIAIHGHEGRTQLVWLDGDYPEEGWGNLDPPPGMDL